MREYLALALVTALSVILLVQLMFVVLYGAITIREPNTFILGIEIIMLVSCMIFAIINMVKIIRKYLRANDKEFS